MKKGYSLQQLADKIGASKAHVWDLETMRAKNPSLEVLQKLSTHLGVPIAALVGEDSPSGDENDEAVVMYRDLKTLESEDRETIKLMMERLMNRSKGSTDNNG